MRRLGLPVGRGLSLRSLIKHDVIDINNRPGYSSSFCSTISSKHTSNDFLQTPLQHFL